MSFNIVPSQQNGWDCGIFLCRNVFAMLEMICSSNDNELKNKYSIVDWHIQFEQHPSLDYSQNEVPKMRNEIIIYMSKLSILHKDRIIHIRRISQIRL